MKPTLRVQVQGGIRNLICSVHPQDRRWVADGTQAEVAIDVSLDKAKESGLLSLAAWKLTGVEGQSVAFESMTGFALADCIAKEKP